MNLFIYDLLTNIFANVIFWLSGGIVIWILVSGKANRLNRFFGTTKQREVTIYLSSFRVEPILEKEFGIVKGHRGIAVPSDEFSTIPKLASLFSSNPLNLIPEIFVGFVDSFWIIKRPEIEFMPSPHTTEMLNFKNAICVGGPAFNFATDYYQKSCNPYFSMSADSGRFAIRINRTSRAGEVVHQDGFDLGFVQKMVDHEHKCTVFLVGGIGIGATMAAVDYLVSEWSNLYKRYQDDEFGVIIRCPYLNNVTGGRIKPDVLLSLPN